MTQAIRAHGTLLARGDGGSPENFTTIAEVTAINGPELELELADVTSHDSTYREYLAGIADYGEVNFDVNMVPDDTQHNGLVSDAENGTLRNFTLTLPSGTLDVCSFAAYVVGVSRSMPIGADPYKASITLKVSGGVTWA